MVATLSQKPLLPLLSLQYAQTLEGKPALTPYGNGCTEHERGLLPAGTVSGLGGVKFLTVAEVAALMRVSKMSVYRLIHAGELEAVRFGRNFRVTEAARSTRLPASDSFYETG